MAMNQAHHPVLAVPQNPPSYNSPEIFSLGTARELTEGEPDKIFTDKQLNPKGYKDKS